MKKRRTKWTLVLNPIKEDLRRKSMVIIMPIRITSWLVRILGSALIAKKFSRKKRNKMRIRSCYKRQSASIAFISIVSVN